MFSIVVASETRKPEIIDFYLKGLLLLDLFFVIKVPTLGSAKY